MLNRAVILDVARQLSGGRPRPAAAGLRDQRGPPRADREGAGDGKELFSVHMMLLVDHGIYIMENANREPLGHAGVGVALLVVTPLRIAGATGSPLRVLALA